MASSTATTVAAYLDELPLERRAVLAPVLEVMRAHMPNGYRESMSYGMISYDIPLERFPDTYNKHPLVYAALAAQKNYYAVYLMCAYSEAPKARELKDAFARAGKKLDMGKSCVRFKSLDDLPLDAIGAFVASTSVDEFIALYKAVRETPTKAAHSARAGGKSKRAKPSVSATSASKRAGSSGKR